jgi:cytochrome c oxidase accessory protein FixG
LPAGDCIDCQACVSTCPTGIDIRDGLQLECIGCTQCIDACDRVMDRTRRPRGLIRYTSLEELRGRAIGLWRPRVFAYGAIVVGAVAALSWLGSRRQSFELDVVRRTGAPFYVQADGAVCNPLRVRLTNRAAQDQSFVVELIEPGSASLIVGESPVTLAPLQLKSTDALVCLPRSEIAAGRREARLRVSTGEAQDEVARFVLLGPLGGTR